MKQELYELTNPQKPIWLTEQYFTDTAVNTICGYTFITDTVNLEVLKKAIYEMIKSNDGMRLKINSKNDTTLQYVSDFEPFDIPTVELQTKEDIEKKALEMASTPFMQSNEFLFQFILFKLPDNSGGFIVNVHHLIGDSWSLGLIAKEVTTIYSELLTNIYEETNYPSYLNYIEAENNYKNSEKYLKDKAYWENIFQTIPEIASLNTSKESKKEISCKGNREKFTLSEKDLTNIKTFCDTHKISVYNFFMAVYSLYVSRVSHLDDFVMGTPILNRTSFEQKHTMGMFISVVPLRVTINENHSFLDFAKKIATDTMSLFRHQKYSYQSILEDIRKRDSSIPNLYNVILSYQITKTTEESNHVHYSTDWVFNSCSADELQIHLFDLNEEAMTVAYDYKSDVFTSQEIANLHARILAMIKQIVENEAVLLNEIDIVTPEEKHQILYDFNNTSVDYPRDKTIVDLFEEQVNKTPDATAVIFENQKLTYRELNEKANQLAHYLVENKIGNDDIVCLLLDKSLESIISIFATLKVGAVYLPIDINYPSDRIDYIIQDSKSKILLTTKEHMNQSRAIQTTCIDLDASIYLQYSSENLYCKSITPDSLAYIMYTSGSTGNPKGVMVKHRNIVRLIKNNKFIEFDKNERILQTGSIVFDACTFEIFGALLNGFELYIIKKEELLDASLLQDYLIKHKITILWLTAPLFNQLCEESPHMFHTVKTLLTGGDVLSPKHINMVRTANPNLTVINGYGPTENTTFSCCFTINKKYTKSIPIGGPISNSTAYVVSPLGKLCPIGVSGELWVGGDGVAKGYLNNDKLTHKKFIPNPFGTGILYKTGDLVKWLPDGTIDFIGRIDNQVKIRGFRVELSEIDEKILSASQHIKQSLTIVHNINATKTICSYIASDSQIDMKELKANLGKSLPSYMIPTFITLLKDFPLNINGKIDMKALPIPSANDMQEEIVPERNDLDKSILMVLSQILGITHIGITNSFFDLGGDSLSAISFTNTLSQKLNLSINVGDVFAHPVIKDLSDYIATLSENHHKTTIKKVEERKYYPASSAQKRMYYASSIDTNSVLYNIAGGIIVDKSLDISLLQNCFQTLIDRHEVLRTHFDIVDNEIVQIIDHKVDFTLLNDSNNSNCLEDLDTIYTDFVKPFDLSKAPLFRAKAVTLSHNQMLLLLDMHHIISDGTSLSILLQELCDLYNGNTLPEKQVDYKDFTLWEKEQFEKEEFKQAKDFWVNQFKDEIPLLNMPTTYTRPSVQSFEGANYHVTLSSDIFQKVNETSKKLGITPYMLMLSCYYILLSKYTSQDDIVVGTPIVGRELPELSSMLGMFVNTLALRNKVNHDSNFSDFAINIKDYCLTAFQNQAYPFDELVKELNIKRDTSRNALVDVMFVYQNNGYPTIHFNDIHTEYYTLDNNVSKFDLTLEILPVDNELSLRFEYCTKLFDEDFVKRLSSHYINILNAILENSDLKIADIDMLSEEEKNQILYDFNNTSVDCPRDKTIVDLFEEQVTKTPNNIALVFEDKKLTYKELNEKANQLARYLIESRVSSNSIVGIYLNKSIEVIVSMFAILKVGAAFLPLDVDYPEDRLNYIVHHSAPKVILSSRNLKPNIQSNVIFVDLTENIYKNPNTDNINLNLTPENLMYVMYTSGSTGNPKGVMVSHKNIIRLAAFPNFIEFAENEIMVQTGTIVFDACIFEIFGSLLHGFKLYILKKENILDIPYFSKFLEKERVTILFLTTGLFNQLGLQNPSMFKHLKYLLTGGDVISNESIQKILQCSPNLKIINCYGPTENGSYSTCYPVIGNENIIPIGKPITNSTAYVIHNNTLCPIGVPGELWVGGDGVSKGYLNNNNLTKEQFISNPFGVGTLYKTGDLVKWLPNGNIEFIGRIDNQVKVRGFRIELSEIDRKILLPENKIEQSLTIIQLINNTKTLCSYIVANSKIDIKELKSKLGSLLPSYMIPTFITQLESFPLNMNGKIDIKALPVPSANDMQKEFIPSRNELDKSIIDILSEILNITNISITDSFFDLGGDSLSAISFANILTQKLNISISVGNIFAHPIITDLSDYISTLTVDTKKATIQKAEEKEYYPASSAQKRMYYASSVDKDSILYNISGGIIIDKVLDINLLQECFNLLIDRHEVLRTHFTIIDNDIVQIIDDKIHFKLSADTASLDNLDKVYTNFVKPFNLAKAPLLRAKVITLKDNKMMLLLDMHHIISDGTSLAILLQELCDLYNGKTLSDKHVDYKDFSLWEKEQFEKEEFKQAKDFWVNQFKDEIPLLNMPTTYPRPSVQSFSGSNYHTILSNEIFDKVTKVAKNLDVTPYMLLLSCYYILLSKYTSQDDIVVGTPIIGRGLPELSNMLGMFVNTLALRNKIDHSNSFHVFVDKVKEYCLSAFQNQTYPFDELIKALNIKRDSSRGSLVDVMFVYQNNGYPTINLQGFNAQYYTPDSNVSKFDLTLEVIPMNDKLSLRFEYCTKLFDEDFIKRLSSHYINILNTILDNSEIKIADIDMLSDEEKHKILYDFNNTKVSYPRDKTIVDLFEEQVQKTPDNIAVIFENNSLTYKELNEKANQLARYLIDNGVSSNSIVGIMLPRSLEIMVAFLGVLKAGACYVPIDPTLPKVRIEYMLKDSNASILLKLASIKNIDINFEHITNIDINNSDVYNYANSNLNTTISSDDSSYVIYTSGSTGNPKGVVLKHLSLTNLTYYLNTVVKYLKNDSSNLAIASITTISFDIFIFETIVSLQKGLKVIIANEAQQTNPKLLDELIEKYDIKAIQMTPSRMDIFINNKEYMPHLSNLKYITLAGEALSDKLKEQIRSLSDITVYNGYGPSETTVFSTFTNVTSYSKVTIGVPLANTYVYVLDKDNHLCPVGIPGELYISGDGVGKGYLNNKELTDKSFLNNIFMPNSIMYKTGDLVKFLPNGELDYIGRVDNQIKIRGLRIELDEIQKWISQYKDVNKVVLSSNKDRNNRQYLAAYLTVNNRISVNDLKIYLGKHIPKYMIPTYFIILDEFPYLPNGKINRKALPLPTEDTSSNKKYMAPTNKLEIEIAQIFENLLAVSPISINDNFFDIGGDSLLAMSLQLELLKLHINVSYSDIFMFPSIKELAEHIYSNSRQSISKINVDSMKAFDTILNNTTYLPSKLEYSSPGNILLTGVTGFLGAHILDSFLRNESGIVYCLIRTEPGLTINQKLLNKLHYYFDNQYDGLIGSRIIPIQSDISLHNLGLSDSNLALLTNHVNVVINSAAKVSHYGNYGDYKKINVDGTQNLVDFCMKYNKRFYQISTLSVSGNSLVDDSYTKQNFNTDIDFNENNFYINQSLDNVYVRSKFEAERVVLDNILKGLDGYIIRVGNLMNRLSDGKFQPNVGENAYINRLIAYYKIGCIPNYLLGGYLELTPVDCCANAIIMITQYNCKTNRIFHLLNHKNIDVLYFINTLNQLYDKISIVDNNLFIETIDKILANPNAKNILSGLINDFDENRLIVYSSPVKIKSDFTIKYLDKVGFDWPELNEEYIKNFLEFFSNLNLLNRKDGI